MITVLSNGYGVRVLNMKFYEIFYDCGYKYGVGLSNNLKGNNRRRTAATLPVKTQNKKPSFKRIHKAKQQLKKQLINQRSRKQ